MVNGLCKLRPLCEMDTVTRIAKHGTLVDDLSFQRSAAIPRQKMLPDDDDDDDSSTKRLHPSQGCKSSIVFGYHHPKGNASSSTMYSSSFLPPPPPRGSSSSSGPEQQVDRSNAYHHNVKSMRDKNFIFSSATKAAPTPLSESRDILRKHSLSHYTEAREPKVGHHPATVTSVCLGFDAPVHDTTSRTTYNNNKKMEEEENGADKKPNNNNNNRNNSTAQFTFGSDPHSWKTEQTDKYTVKDVPSRIVHKAVMRMTPLEDAMALRGEYETSTGSTYTATNLPQERVQPFSAASTHIAFGYEPRECKTTYRGHFKDIEYIVPLPEMGGTAMMTMKSTQDTHNSTSTSSGSGTSSGCKRTVRTMNTQSSLKPGVGVPKHVALFTHSNILVPKPLPWESQSK